MAPEWKHGLRNRQVSIREQLREVWTQDDNVERNERFG